MRGRPQHGRHRPPEKTSPIPKGRWAIGIHAVEEALKVRPKSVSELWLKEGWESSEDLRRLSEMTKNVRNKPQGVLDKLGTGHQGVAACIGEDPAVDWDSLAQSDNAVVLLADGIQDPHNLGAILRTAWLLGAQALFITENRSAPLTPTAMKVACGGAEHVPVEVDGNLLTTANQLKEQGFWIFGLDGEGRGSLWQTKFSGKVALIVGSEESGIRTPLKRVCDELLHIPQADSAASFNASVATAIALAEVQRQLGQNFKKS